MRKALATALVSVVLALPATAQQPPPRTVAVTGEGSVAAVPDLAVVRLGVETNAGTAEEALAANSAAMQSVVDRVRAEGVEERDLQTSQLSLSPRYQDRAGGPPDVAGYTARNILTVRIRELDRLGQIIGALAGDGANAFEGLSFSVAEPGALNDEALRLAVADARRQAQLLAEEAGITLGSVASIEVGAGGDRPMEMAQMRMSADSVPVARGEVEVSASVRMVFEIAE